MENQVVERNVNEKTKLFLCVRDNKTKRWTEDENKLLLVLAEKYNFRNWKQIAIFFHERSGSQCYERFRVIRPDIKKGMWTPEEDQELKDLINIHGKKWSIISKIMKIKMYK